LELTGYGGAWRGWARRGEAGQDKARFLSIKHFAGDDMEFQKSSDAKILESVLGEAVVGKLISYEELSKAIGRDVRKHAMSALGTARRGVFKEKRILFGVQRGIGLVRIDDAGIVKSIEKDRIHLHRTARKSLKKLAAVEFSNLDESGKRDHVVASAQMGAVAMFANKNSGKKIESKIAAKAEALPIGETLKLFV
jgi:hypothetical protein